MTSRRFGQEGAETRTALLDLAEQMMSESGYAALSSRQLGKAAGLSPQIVYYYFKTMDDLFVALVMRSSDYYMQAIDKARDSEEPLMAMWELSCDRSRAIVVQELMALANHRKILMQLLSDFGRNFHRKQTEIIEREIAAGNLDAHGIPADMIAATMEITARGFASGVGYDIPAHSRAQTYITEWIGRMTGSATRKPARQAKVSATSAAADEDR